jgi:hypothetical protein
VLLIEERRLLLLQQRQQRIVMWSEALIYYVSTDYNGSLSSALFFGLSSCMLHIKQPRRMRLAQFQFHKREWTKRANWLWCLLSAAGFSITAMLRAKNEIAYKVRDGERKIYGGWWLVGLWGGFSWHRWFLKDEPAWTRVKKEWPLKIKLWPTWIESGQHEL